MSNLTNDIFGYLKEKGFKCSIQTDGVSDIIHTTIPDGEHTRVVLPLSIIAYNADEASEVSSMAYDIIQDIRQQTGEYPLIITEDRWHSQRKMMEKRLLAHMETFKPVYARNCEIRRIDKTLAREFLEKSHSYGHAACRYCYGMFLKRHTGHIAESNAQGILPGELVAVATFSNARKWIKGDMVIRSYEWTRYASLPEVRISGGMGRFLKHFIKEVNPDDIMTYSDLEWSEGDVYSRLGFTLEGQKEPVIFLIDENWKRVPIKNGTSEGKFFQNFGSNKYRLKLTDYE